jgi:hypothetical protein
MYEPDQPGLLQIEVIKSINPDPTAPPDARAIDVHLNFRNFPNPMELLISLEVAKAQIIQIMMQQGNARVQQKPDLKKYPWSA